MHSLAETEAPLVVEDVFFPAAGYLLHGRFAYPETARARGAVVLAGPHPLLGGNMDNNIVRALGDGLAQRELATLRFNYRGVGQSTGPVVDVERHLAEFWQTSHVPGEADLWQDVEAAAAFLSQAAGADLPVALIGYSFGCALLPHVRTSATVPLVLIAPTVARHDYGPFLSLTNPLLVIASEDDFATDAGQLRAWFDTLRAPAQLVLKRFDNHFFRGYEPWLVDTIDDFFSRQWR